MVDRGWVDAIFQHGVDIYNRRIFLGEINETNVDMAIKGLYLMETADAEKPCEIFISSYGGTIYDALALYDIMHTIQCPIYTFAYGKCMSAAPLLLAAGEPGHRWVAPNVSLMHHDWVGEVDGKGMSVMADVKHNETQSNKWMELLAGKTKRQLRWWREKARRSDDFYFGADEAIDWGLADNIWVEK